MTFTAHFHGGPRDGTSRVLEVDDPPVSIYPDDDELDLDERLLRPIEPGQPYPTIPNSRYELRDGSIADGLHYDWHED